MYNKIWKGNPRIVICVSSLDNEARNINAKMELNTVYSRSSTTVMLRICWRQKSSHFYSSRSLLSRGLRKETQWRGKHEESRLLFRSAVFAVDCILSIMWKTCVLLGPESATLSVHWGLVSRTSGIIMTRFHSLEKKTQWCLYRAHFQATYFY